MMAIACLMIESIESFYRGWKDSNGKSKKAFRHFFARHDGFDDFRSYSLPFYINVRCGIHHQAETTGGWKITRRKGAPLFDEGSKTINANLFLERLREVLDTFCEGLKTAEWNSTEWNKVRMKMDALCRNCAP